MKKTLGLDVGIASVGWAVIDDNNEIVDVGVRLFNEADSARNKDRRGFRGGRRILRRRKQRIIDMKTLLINEGFISKDFKPLSNPYELRLKGLSQKLTNDELATILLQYAKRRGSSLETVEDESSAKDGTKAILLQNKQQLKDEKYVVNVQLERFKNEGQIRGTHNVFRTEDYVKEINDILKVQNLDHNLSEKIINIITRRRHFSEGPGNYFSPSPYGRYRRVEQPLLDELNQYIHKNYNDKYLKEKFHFNYKDINYTCFKSGMIVNRDKYDLIALMRGKCSIYPEELRAPKNSFSAELFNLLNDLNNLKILNRLDPKITKQEKEEIINIIRTKGNITVNQLLKLLKAEELEVTGFRINNKEKPIISEFPGYKKLLKVYKDLNIKIADDKTLDKIVEILTETVVEEERFEKLNNLLQNNELAKSLSQLTGITGYHSLSLKAIYLLNEEMINESLNQQQIITKNNLVKKEKVNKLVIDESAILSPVAKRAHREALKLVDELIKIHGDFDKIIIETTRDKNSNEERKRIKELQDYHKKSREEAEALLKDYGSENINNANILKLRLYKQQNGKCAYTGEPIDLGLLIRDPRRYEVDHIIPVSVSYDDSLNNKVLVTPKANQDKGNLTPFGYFTSGKASNNKTINNWDKFVEYVNSNNNYTKVKKQNLLFMEDITKYSVLQEFINRNLVDTSYAVRTLMTTLKQYFETNNIPTKVLTIKGKQTNRFRNLAINLWFKNNPGKTREENPLVKDRDIYIHHAYDALIIAGLANQKTIRKLYQLKIDDKEHIVNKRSGEIFDLDNPMRDNEIIQYLLKVIKITDNDIKYSWKIDTKPNRSLSDQTIYSTRLINNEHYVVKSYDNIYDLDNVKLDKIFSDKQKVNLLVYKHDRKTFDILYNIYKQYEHEKKPFLAYKELHGPIRKYSKKNNGPVVTKLKYISNVLGNYMDITPKNTKDKKVVKLQISPYRADMYYSKKEKMYKFVTIRYNDIKLEHGKYIIDEIWYNEEKMRKNINDSYEFMFSLYRNNLVEIVELKNNITKKNYYRYIGVNDDSKNKIEFKLIDKHTSVRIKPTINQNIIRITKYNVSPTGIKSKVIKEDLQLEL